MPVASADPQEEQDPSRGAEGRCRRDDPEHRSRFIRCPQPAQAPTRAAPAWPRIPSMPITTALSTEIKRVSILDEHGQFDEKLGKDLIPDDDLIRLYGDMVLCRKLDEVAFKLQRSGRMGTYP